MKLLLEACVETLEEAIVAEKKGAHRIELCSRLDLDGLTPNLKLVLRVLNSVSIPVKVMIRPRGGDFYYNGMELDTMRKQIRLFKKTGVSGVVFGVLNRAGRLDLDQIITLAELASPLEVTIHKAIDKSKDPVEEIRQLVKNPRITSVLTSGKADTAGKGQHILKLMMEAAGTSLTIIPAGRITKENLESIHRAIGATEYHGRAIVGKLAGKTSESSASTKDS